MSKIIKSFVDNQKQAKDKDENNEIANDIVLEIEQILEEAWEEIKSYYDTKAPKLPKSWEYNEKEAKKSHWIYWNEYDLMFHIGRFFYEALKKKDNNKFSNIEIHFEKSINSTNF